MSFLFSRNKVKTPQEIISALNELVTRRDAAVPDSKIMEEISRLLSLAALIACGERGTADPDPDQMAALAKEIYATDVLVHLMASFEYLDFESRRSVSRLFTFLLQRRIGSHSTTVNYFLQKPSILELLLTAAGTIKTHSSACAILTEVAKYEQLVQQVLSLPDFWDLFEYCLSPSFEVVSGCFLVINSFIVNFPEVSSRFLMENTRKFITAINKLIESDNYVARRQALSLQASIIRLRRNCDFMMAYVCDVHNLKIVMRLTRDKSKVIKYENFQLFKVFIANPRKPKAITDLLIRNKARLLETIESNMDPENKDDDMFKAERKFVIERLRALPDTLASSNGSSVNHTAVASAQ